MGKRLGIAFAGGEGPEPAALRRLLAGAGCLAGAEGERPLLAAADSGLLLAEAAGLRPDWVVGDMDSLGGEGRLLGYPPGRVVRHPADKDFSDTELALELLWREGCGEVWIAGGGGGRMAHVFAIRDLFERERFPSRWLTAREDIRCIDSGGAASGGAGFGAAAGAGFANGAAAGGSALALELGRGASVSVFPVGLGPWSAESRGLKWPLGEARWERGLFGLSNEALGGPAEIRAGQGRFLIVFEGV